MAVGDLDFVVVYLLDGPHLVAAAPALIVNDIQLGEDLAPSGDDPLEPDQVGEVLLLDLPDLVFDIVVLDLDVEVRVDEVVVPALQGGQLGEHFVEVRDDDGREIDEPAGNGLQDLHVLLVLVLLVGRVQVVEINGQTGFVRLHHLLDQHFVQELVAGVSEVVQELLEQAFDVLHDSRGLDPSKDISFGLFWVDPEIGLADLIELVVDIVELQPLFV